MRVLYAILGVVIFLGLMYIDKKAEYNEIFMKKCTDDRNGSFYFSVSFYIWQINNDIILEKIKNQGRYIL